MKKFIITILIFLFFSPSIMAGERINLAFNIDNNYPTYMLLTINSIFKNNKSDSQYYIYVIENDLTNRNKTKIKKFIEKNKHKVEFINISQEKLDVGREYYYSSLPITNIAFARIYLPELLPDLDKILYLDSDLLVLSDIKDLYNTNLSGYPMGLVLDIGYLIRLNKMEENLKQLEKTYKNRKPIGSAILKSLTELKTNIQSTKINPYYNDGVILMDLKLMRKYHLMEKMVDYALKHPNLEYADQDVINYSIPNYIKKIDPKWNNQFFESPYFKQRTITTLSDKGIVHYIGTIKPWMTMPKKSCPERYMYFRNWFSSEFRFYYINALCKNIKNRYISFCKYAINEIKIQIGYPDKNQETIHVAFTIDNNYWLYTLLTVNSILKNNTSHSPYHFYIIEDNLTDKNKQKMMKYITKRHQKVEFINIDTSVVDGGQNLYKKTKQHQYISRIAMARIFLPDLLPDNVYKVLYLDSDLLVNTDLKELYDTDIYHYAAGMVFDITEHQKMQNLTKNSKNKKTYYNDGVILMNLGYWRKYKITEQMVDYMRIKKYLPKMDQDLINIILKNKIKKLDARWNNQYGHTLINGQNMESNIIDNCIIHYIGPEKPWLYTSNYYRISQFIYRRLYSRYWTKSSLVNYQIPLKIKQLKNLYVLTGQESLITLNFWNYTKK